MNNDKLTFHNLDDINGNNIISQIFNLLQFLFLNEVYCCFRKKILIIIFFKGIIHKKKNLEKKNRELII